MPPSRPPRDAIASVDERGFVKRLKPVLPTPWLRAATRLFNGMAALLPLRLKYRLTGMFVRRRAPYRLLGPSDTVVQIGSARDVLRSGRSRAVHFARLVPRGKVLVVEADPANCEALRQAAERIGLTNLDVSEGGAWSERATLTLLSSSSHPAANLLAEVRETRTKVPPRHSEVKIEVDTVDSLLKRHAMGTPRLVSITTNGAELEILAGLTSTLAAGCRFVSLAATREGLTERVSELGYECIAKDDRGFCYERRDRLDATAEGEGL